MLDGMGLFTAKDKSTRWMQNLKGERKTIGGRAELAGWIYLTGDKLKIACQKPWHACEMSLTLSNRLPVAKRRAAKRKRQRRIYLMTSSCWIQRRNKKSKSELKSSHAKRKPRNQTSLLPGYTNPGLGMTSVQTGTSNFSRVISDYRVSKLCGRI